METRSSKDRQTSQPEGNSSANTGSCLPHAAPDELSRKRFSYLWPLFILIGSIFVAEIVAMVIVFELPPLPYQYMTLIDVVIMVVLIFPMLYFFSVRPLILQSNKRLQAEKSAKVERQHFNDILETLPGYLVLLTPDYHVPFANRFFRERFGEAHGQHCYEYLFGRETPCEICETYKVLQTGKPGRWEWTGPDWPHLRCLRFSLPGHGRFPPGSGNGH